MRLSPILKKTLSIGIQRAFNKYSLQTFSVTDCTSLGTNFEDATAGNGGTMEDLVVAFIEELERLQTLQFFIQAIKAKGNSWFDDFFILFEKIFAARDGSYVYNPEIFDRFILNDNLPFLSRKEIKTLSYNICKRPDNKRVVAIKGDSASGLSYLKWYFTEMDKNHKCFNFYYLNLYEDILLPKGGTQMIEPADIAEEILDIFEITDFTISRPLKQTPFHNRLLRAVKDDTILSIFYIDQFDVPIREDVKSFLGDLAEFFLEKDTKCQIILGGYPHINQWDFELSQQTKEIDLKNGNFTEAHIDEFFEGAYGHMEAKYDLEFSKESYLLKYEDRIKEIKALLPTESNVTVVGRKAGEWFKDFKQELEDY